MKIPCSRSVVPAFSFRFFASLRMTIQKNVQKDNAKNAQNDNERMSDIPVSAYTDILVSCCI